MLEKTIVTLMALTVIVSNLSLLAGQVDWQEILEPTQKDTEHAAIQTNFSRP
jgi:hypothetical protein